MKKNNIKKINYGARSVVLNCIIVILIILIFVLIRIGIQGLSKNSVYSTSSLKYRLENNDYASLLDAYLSDYDPSLEYSDEYLSYYAAAEYYQHASLYVAAKSYGDATTAATEKALMDDAYTRMGENQSYAELMLDSLQ